ncbi:MAG: UDP-N-acetylmuramate dehydrogenase [Acidobacteria bacterium]|nr:UDP-N-acetylmuramate dehydrogenase [Acidobacteriota bacterium]
MQVLEGVPLAPYTTLGIGGDARYLVEAQTEEQILEALEFASAARLPIFILGGGSNILVSDRGFPGLVIRIALRGIDPPASETSGRVSAAAGEDWDRFVEWCVDRRLAGVECMSGIPGTVGATPIQNVGAYGQEVSDVIVSLRLLDRQAGKVIEMSRAECEFGYRRSIFNTTQRDRYIVLRVAFVLKVAGKASLRHGDLGRHFAGRPDPPSVWEVRSAVLRIRRGKGMVIDPADPDSRSVGSFFKNPVISRDTLSRAEQAAVRQGCLAPGQKLPHFETARGEIKIPAAWLIEQAGFPKGYGSDKVALSAKHALAVVNRGGAGAQDVVAFVRTIQAGVRAAFGINLVPEAIFVGFPQAGGP